MKDKKIYKVVITETLQKTVIVEAGSEREAHRRAEDAWRNSEYSLDENNFQGVEFHVCGEADDYTEKLFEFIETKGGPYVE